MQLEIVKGLNKYISIIPLFLLRILLSFNIDWQLDKKLALKQSTILKNSKPIFLFCVKFLRSLLIK
jgi:hypothetical protein